MFTFIPTLKLSYFSEKLLYELLDLLLVTLDRFCVLENVKAVTLIGFVFGTQKKNLTLSPKFFFFFKKNIIAVDYLFINYF